MNQSKVMSLKAKLEVDLNSIKRIETELKKLSNSFKQFQTDVSAATQGMDKVIRQAFLGKKGTDRTTIKKFFKDEFKDITKAFTEEIRNAAAQITTQATAVSNDVVKELAKTIISQQKKIENLSKNATKKAVVKTTTDNAKPTKFKLSDEDKAFRRYVMEWQKQQEIYDKLVMKDKQLRDKKAKLEEVRIAKSKASSLYGDVLAEQKAMKQINAAQAFETKLKSSNKYADIIAEQKAMKQLQTEKQKYWMNVVQQETNAAKISRQVDEREYQRKVAAEKALTKQHGEELLVQLKQEQQLYAERKRLQEAQLNESKEYLKNLMTSGPFAEYFAQIKESPLKSLTSGISSGVKGIMGGLTSVYEKFKTLFKLIATGGALAVGSFLGIGAVVQKLASGVLFATEKMRGYQIALFGMMKTQDGVNELMEKAFKVTKNLPISYEQVYQSTKAFTLIGPVRDMLKNVGETETVLKRMYSITMALSQIEPEWGLAGAQFSLREALSGDLRSLQRRFEIPVNLIYSKDGRSLRQLKNDPEAMSEALSDYFKEFYNEETLGMAANQFGAIISKIEGIWFNFQSAIGNAGFYDMFVDKLKKVRDQLDVFTETLEFKDVTNRISNALGSSLNSILSVVEKLTVSFGRLIGINVESSNAFQVAADVIEKFAAFLRIVNRFVTETDVFGILNSSLQKTKQLVYEIASYGLKIFKTVARDVDMLIAGIEKLPSIKGLFTENTGRGLFYLWLFGPENIIQTISGFSTAAIAAFVGIGTAIQALMALNTVFSAMVGTNVLAWGAAIAGMVLGLEQIGGTFKFAINSVDDALESSKFYKMYAWLTGKDTTDDMVNRFQSLVKSFGGSSDYYSALTPFKEVNFAQSLSSVSGISAEHIQTKMTKNPEAFLTAFLKKEGGVDQLREAIENLNIVTLKMAENDPRRANMLRATATMDSVLDSLVAGNIDFSKISERYRTEDKKLGMYQDDDFGQLNKARQNLQNFYTDLSKLTGNAIDTIGIMLKPALSDSEKALFAARKGTQIMDRGDDAIKNINDGAKIAGASLLNIFKMAGFGVGVTSGWRNDAKKDSLHNVSGQSYAIDYQPNIGGKLITGAADVKTPEFEALVSALQANENIAKVILEYKDKSIFGDKYKGISEDMKTADKGAVIHVEFKKDLEKTEAGMIGLLSSLGNGSAELMRIQQIAEEELGKVSPQLPQKNFLEKPFQRATEFISNIYRPTMDAIKDGYKSGVEVIADSTKEFDELFKADEGVAQFGPTKIIALQKKQTALLAGYADMQKKGVTQTSLFEELVGLKGISARKPIVGNYESMFDKNKTVNYITSGSKELVEYMEFLNDIPGYIGKLKIKEKIEEEITAEAWGTALESKTYEFVDLVGSNIGEFQSDLMAKMAQEAMAQSVYENLGKVSATDISDFYTAMGPVISQMKAANISLDEAIKNAELEGVGVKKLAKITQDHTKELIDNNLAYMERKQGIESNINAIKKLNNIEQLASKKGQFMKTKEERSAYYGQYSTLLEEGQGISIGDAFTTGLESSQNEFQNTFQIMFEAGKELNNNLTKTFEDGFFNILSGKINSLGDMFKELGNVVKNTIFGIISKMLAISATKLILGVDIQGGTSGAAGGLGGLLGGGSGGLGGLLGNLFGGKTSTSAVGGDVASKIIGGIGAGGANSGIGSVLNMASSGTGGLGSLVTNVLAGNIGTKTVTKGGLGGLLGGAKKFLTSGTGLATIGALSFLSQPGRLFGGTKDKTGDAAQANADYNVQRQNYINRRGSDAEKYYMGNTSALKDFSFSGIGYSTWTSGDGWFKGPKEKHAGNDTTAYSNSIKDYYNMLLGIGRDHYSKMKDINKTAQTNELKSIKMQFEYDTKKLNMIKTEFDNFSSSSYTAADKYEKIDEYRDKYLEQEFANWQAKEEIARLEKETIYKQMEYLGFVSSFYGEDSIRMAKVSIEIEKRRVAEYTKGTIEWYDSKMNLMRMEADLTKELKSIATETRNAISSAAKEIYSLKSTSSLSALPKVSGMYKEIEKFQSGNYSESDILKYANYEGTVGTGTFNLENKKATYGLPSNLRAGIRGTDNINSYQSWFEKTYMAIKEAGGTITDKGWGIGQSTPLGEINYTMLVEETMKTYSKSIEEIIADLNKQIEFMLQKTAIESNISNIRNATSDLVKNVDHTLIDTYKNLSNNYNALLKDNYMSALDKSLAILGNNQELVEFYNGLASNVNAVMKQGFLGVKDTALSKFSTAIAGGFNDSAMVIYDNIMMTARKYGAKSNMLSSIRDMEDFSIYNQVMGTKEMAGLKTAMGGMATMSGTDPYSAWFDFNKQVIQTRIGNAEQGSDEWFSAQNDLFNLMIENAEKLKEKAEQMNRSLEDMLGKIEETMRMRIAEERQTAKGDVYFVDVGSTRSSQQMLDRMLASVKSNDPEAMKLIEEFRKKMLGIGR